MKKILSLIFIFTLLIATGCQREESQVVEITSATDKGTSQNITVEETTIIPTETVTEITTFSKNYELQKKYNLTDTDMDIINAIYYQRDKWETKQDEQSYEYTRNKLDVYHLNMLYDGERILFIPYYLVLGDSNARQLSTVYKVIEDGYVLGVLPNYNIQELSTLGYETVAYKGYDKANTEDEKLETLAELYSDYKKKRQEKYGDVEEVKEINIDDLSEHKQELLNNILNTEKVWKSKLSRSTSKMEDCVLIKIWDFGDGSAEILCSYGTKTEVNGSIYFSGIRSGYAINGNDATELTDEEQERLETDLSYQSSCDWSVSWTDDKKKQVLFDFLKRI